MPLWYELMRAIKKGLYMLKQQVSFDVMRNDRVYRISCDPDSPLGELYDALNEMRSFVIQKILDEQKSQEPKEPDQSPKQD